MSAATQEQAKAVISAIMAVSEAIRQAGSIASGTIYAACCGSMTLGDYQAILKVLKNAGLVKENGFNLLTWTGPNIEKELKK